jgi:hypothetical protein
MEDIDQASESAPSEVEGLDLKALAWDIAYEYNNSRTELTIPGPIKWKARSLDQAPADDECWVSLEEQVWDRYTGERVHGRIVKVEVSCRIIEVTGGAV